MKKSRPGVILSVISSLDKVEELTNIIFKETTSIGIRLQEILRKKLTREIIEIETEWGTIKAKKVTCANGAKLIPEYEECKKIAKEKNIPLKEVHSKIIQSARF